MTFQNSTALPLPTRDQTADAVHPRNDFLHGENKKMLLYEDLSRYQHAERQQMAAQHRMANRLLAVRRWERLAGWAAKHAARVRES